MLLGAIGVSILTKAISNLINGIPWWHGLGKAATMGAINAVISFGIGDIASSAFSNYWSQSALKAGLHALKSGTLSAIEGGNFGSGFLSAAIASMAMSTVGKLGINTANPIVQGNKTLFVANNFGNTAEFKAIMLATGATVGGISSSLAGGDFWSGVREGLISGGVNHLMHVVFDGIENEKSDDLDDQNTGTGEKHILFSNNEENKSLINAANNEFTPANTIDIYGHGSNLTIEGRFAKTLHEYLLKNSEYYKNSVKNSSPISIRLFSCNGGKYSEGTNSLAFDLSIFNKNAIITASTTILSVNKGYYVIRSGGRWLDFKGGKKSVSIFNSYFNKRIQIINQNFDGTKKKYWYYSRF